jgi:hypothetical protein
VMTVTKSLLSRTPQHMHTRGFVPKEIKHISKLQDQFGLDYSMLSEPAICGQDF